MDLCFQLRRAGRKTVYEPLATVMHSRGRSSRHRRFRSIFTVFQDRIGDSPDSVSSAWADQLMIAIWEERAALCAANASETAIMNWPALRIRRAARRVLAGVYRLADFYVAYQPAPELVWLVADRAIAEAQKADDPYAIAGGAWALTGAL